MSYVLRNKKSVIYIEIYFSLNISCKQIRIAKFYIRMLNNINMFIKIHANKSFRYCTTISFPLCQLNILNFPLKHIKISLPSASKRASKLSILTPT